MAVIPNSFANSIARLEAAEIEATIGTPATTAFCAISKPSRPLTMRIVSESGKPPLSDAPKNFIEGIVPANVLAKNEQTSLRVKQAHCVNPAGTIKVCLRLSQPSTEA